MKKKVIASLVSALAIASILTGCGSNYDTYDLVPNKTTNSYSASEDYYYDEYYEYTDGYEYDEYAGNDSFGTAEVEVDDSASQSNHTDTSRKLIKTVNMDVETLTYDDLLYVIKTKVNTYDGYIEDSYTYNGSKYSYSTDYYRNKYGSMTIRIPADKLDEFLESFSSLCNVLNKTEGVEDVTLTYVDLESRKNALLVEEQRLLELMESAENLQDMLTIESRLTEVRYQLESMESQLRTYDNKINYSTVYLSITEVKEITPEPEPEPETAWERISKGFTESMKSVGHGLSEFGIWIVVKLPFIMLWAGIILAHVFIIRGIVRFNIKKNNKRRVEAERIANGLDPKTGLPVNTENPYEITVNTSDSNAKENQDSADNTKNLETLDAEEVKDNNKEADNN